MIPLVRGTGDEVDVKKTITIFAYNQIVFSLGMKTRVARDVTRITKNLSIPYQSKPYQTLSKHEFGPRNTEFSA